MKNPYKSYRMKLTTLSPIFIGSGEDLNQGQYVFDNRNMNVRILDEGKFANFLIKNNLIDDYSNALLKYGDKINIKRWLEEKRIPLNTPIFSKTIPCKNLTVGSRSGELKPASSLNLIKPFMKGADGLAYIPGSSIKGVIRTAFCSYLVYKNKDKFQNEWQELKRALVARNKGSEINRITKRIEEKCFNKINHHENDEKNGDIFSTLIVGDSEYIPNNKLYITTRLDCSISKNKPTSMPMNLEIIDSNTDIYFNLSINNSCGEYFTIDKIKNVLSFYAKQQSENIIFDKLSEYLYNPMELNDAIIPNICIGGMTGYFNKNIVYSLAPTHQEAVNVLKEYFANNFPKGKHREYNSVTPHTIKAVNDSGDIIPIGWCRLEVEKEINVSDITN